MYPVVKATALTTVEGMAHLMEESDRIIMGEKGGLARRGLELVQYQIDGIATDCVAMLLTFARLATIAAIGY